MSSNNTLSIKLQIAGRIYPLTIHAHEEENIRKAATLLNERVKKYEETFSVKDRQDLLAMCALEQGVQLIQKTTELQNKDRQISEKLESLHNILDKI
ncbi:MAG TPA: cell division protein ZapA [Bacteroidia bacterium]